MGFMHYSARCYLNYGINLGREIIETLKINRFFKVMLCILMQKYYNMYIVYYNLQCKRVLIIFIIRFLVLNNICVFLMLK